MQEIKHNIWIDTIWKYVKTKPNPRIWGWRETYYINNVALFHLAYNNLTQNIELTNISTQQSVDVNTRVEAHKIVRKLCSIKE